MQRRRDRFQLRSSVGHLVLSARPRGAKATTEPFGNSSALGLLGRCVLLSFPRGFVSRRHCYVL